MEVDESSDEESSDNDEYLPDNERKAPQIFTQEENDLVRDLGLPKDGTEYLAAALKKTNLLSTKTIAYFYRDRE